MTVDMKKLNRSQQRALADLRRFGELKSFKVKDGALWAANETHIPECGHSPAIVQTLVTIGLGRMDGKERVVPMEGGSPWNK